MTVLFGAYVSLAGQADEAASLAFREQQLGRRLDIAHHFYTWQAASLLTLDLPDADIAAGRTPLIAWQGITLADVTAGTYDTWIAQVARAMRDLSATVYLRWAWEMNGNWYTWSGPQNGNNPSAYIAAYRRLHGIFQNEGATNVEFVWSPNCSSTPGGTDTSHANNWRNYYPGDAYVDWIGTSAYNAVDLTGLTWNGIRTYIGALVTDWQAGLGGAGGSSKPFMVCEWGCYHGPGGNKPHWLTDAAGYFRSAGVAAVCYFDTDNSASLIPWAVDSTAASLTAFREIAADPAFGGRSTRGGGYAAAVLADAPFGFWPLSETTGVYADAGSGGNPGTAAGTVQRGAVAFRPGLGAAASANGGGRVDVGILGSFGSLLSAGFTLECWVKVGSNGTTPQACVAGVLNTGTTTGLAVHLHTARNLSASAGSTTFWYRNNAGAARALDITTNIYDGLWHHLAWVCDPTAVADTVYVDGVAVAPNSTSNAANVGVSANFGFALYLGARNNRGAVDQQLVGALSDVAVYTTKLPAVRVAAHFAAADTVYSPPPAPTKGRPGVNPRDSTRGTPGLRRRR